MYRDKKHILYDCGEDEFSNKGIWLLVTLYFGSLVAGAILSLIAFKLTHWLDPDASSYMASKPYTRFFDRARWLSVVIILPFLFKSCRLTSFQAIGFARPAGKDFGLWFAYGIAMILLVYASNTVFGAFAFTPDWSGIFDPSEIAEALLAALLIGILEETVFRGLVFRTFYTALSPKIAVSLSALFFAILHFKAPKATVAQIAPSEIGIGDAIHVAWETMAALVTQFNPPYLLTIFLVGIVLHQAFLLKRNLWASIGIHAGWVFTLKLVGSSFDDGETANVFSGTTRLVDGYWVSCWLILFAVIFGIALTRKAQR